MAIANALDMAHIIKHDLEAITKLHIPPTMMTARCFIFDVLNKGYVHYGQMSKDWPTKG